MLVELRERDPIEVAAVPEDNVDALAPVGQLLGGAGADAADVVVLAADAAAVVREHPALACGEGLAQHPKRDLLGARRARLALRGRAAGAAEARAAARVGVLAAGALDGRARVACGRRRVRSAPSLFRLAVE